MQTLVTTSLLGPNIILSILFSNTFNLGICSYLLVKAEFHTHTKERIKL
jgi:hypothetical protein